MDRLLEFLSRHEQRILIALLGIYVAVLSLAAVGELFEVEWILRLF